MIYQCLHVWPSLMGNVSSSPNSLLLRSCSCSRSYADGLDLDDADVLTCGAHVCPSLRDGAGHGRCAQQRQWPGSAGHCTDRSLSLGKCCARMLPYGNQFDLLPYRYKFYRQDRGCYNWRASKGGAHSDVIERSSIDQSSAGACSDVGMGSIFGKDGTGAIGSYITTEISPNLEWWAHSCAGYVDTIRSLALRSSLRAQLRTFG